MGRKSFFFAILIITCLIMSACGTSDQQAFTMIAAAWTPTSKPTPIPPTGTFTSIPPTAIIIPPTPTQESAATLIAEVMIVNHESIPPAGQQLWLQFGLNPGDVLPGSQIETALNNGTLGLVLPGGETKTLTNVPHSPTEDEPSNIWLPANIGIQSSPPPAGTLPLNGMSFENYTDAPDGPQIRIAIESLPELAATGQYQITWQSGDLRSNPLTFTWNGQEITVP